MNITDILKKLAAGEKISVAEKAILIANKDILSDDQVSAAEAAAPVEEDEAVAVEEVVDEKSMKDLIAKSIADRLNEVSDTLVNKFVDGVAAQRAKSQTETVKAVKGEDETRNFMKALFANDHATLKSVSGLSNAAGGYLIPEELRAEVLRVAEDNFGLARRDMRYLPFSGPGNSRKIPALASSVAVSWTDEAAEKQSTAPAFTVIEQTLKKLAAIVPMTDEILEDSNINITALVAELFAEAVAKEEDMQFFNGNGSVWTGILNNGNVNSVFVAGTNPNVVDADDLLSLVDATPSGALAGAKFYMHRSVYSKLRSLRDDAGAGVYIITPPTAEGPAALWGYPIELSDAFPAITVTGNSKPFVLFGNLKRAAIFGDKQELRVKLLDQATVNNTANDASINLAQQDMVAIRIVERVGYVLALPSAVSVLKTVAA